MKKAFKPASLTLFGMAKCFYLFKIDQFSQKFKFFAGIFRWWHVQLAVHVTTRLIRPELTGWTAFVWKIKWPNRIKQDSLGVKTLNANPLFCGSLLILLFFLKICQMVICPVTGTYITTYRYFFAQEWKKPLNLPVERHLQRLNVYIFLKLLSSLRNFKF